MNEKIHKNRVGGLRHESGVGATAVEAKIRLGQESRLPVLTDCST